MVSVLTCFPFRFGHLAFLGHFNAQILVRAKKGFNFSNGSIGNFFFTGARLFFGSLEAAIFLFSSIARIPTGTHVVPVIDTTFDRCTIGALLENGETVIGQSEISHPSQGRFFPPCLCVVSRRLGGLTFFFFFLSCRRY